MPASALYQRPRRASTTAPKPRRHAAKKYVTTHVATLRRRLVSNAIYFISFSRLILAHFGDDDFAFRWPRFRQIA